MRQAGLFQAVLQNRLQIIPICSKIAGSCAKLRADCESKGRAVADMDLLIAAAAHAHNLTVATLNLRHFGMIEGLTVEDWSKP
jgi:predicted nucleic acid-binding protein